VGAERGRSIKLKRAIRFEKVKVRADLDRSITGIADFEGGSRSIDVKLNR
jgi:hypothetical protein